MGFMIHFKKTPRLFKNETLIIGSNPIDFNETTPWQTLGKGLVTCQFGPLSQNNPIN